MAVDREAVGFGEVDNSEYRIYKINFYHTATANLIYTEIAEKHFLHREVYIRHE